MLGNFLFKGAKLRFALWAVGQALPQPTVLKPYFNKALLAIIASAACGMFATIGVVAGVVAVYFYAMNIANSVYPALWLASGAAVLFAAVAYAIARASIDKCITAPKSLKLYSGEGMSQLEAAWNTAVSGFLDGILTPPKPQEKTESTKNEDVAEQAVKAESTPEPEPVIVANASAEEILHRGNNAYVVH